MSTNHQFIAFDNSIVKRYAKTTVSVLTGFRLDPYRPENRIDWLLSSPNRLFQVVWEDGKKAELMKTGFSYEDEVIELYSDVEVKLFERLNKAAIESGALKVYNEGAPEIDTTNLLTDEEVETIATIKQIPSIKKKIAGINSPLTLKRILASVEKHDRPMSVAKAIQSRIDELSANN